MTRPDPVSRREFVTLSAATAGLLLAGHSGHAVPDERATDRYAFLVEHVDPDRSIPTLVRFADKSGFETLQSLDVEFRTHTGGVVAARTELTPAQAESVAAADATTRLEYAPGANPFWTLGAYEDGVFPGVDDSVDFIAYEEALAGLTHLADEHPDRLRVDSIGPGHGHENAFTGEQDTRGLPVVELTDDISDADAFDGRETLVFTLGLHGDERAGVEGGLRFVERVLTGDRPDVAALLSEFVLVFVVPNSDGWVVREPVYDDPLDPPDFRRRNGAGRDLNRQQPVAGWIRPDRLPADPRGASLDGDTDVPAEVATAVPESLALVERLRSYDDVSYLLDVHGMYGHTNAVLAIESSGGTPRDRADSVLLRETLETRLRERLGSVEDWRTAFESVADRTDAQVGCDPDLLCRQPVTLFGDGTALDTIDYTASGPLDAWAALDESDGGLGATALTVEVAFSNSLAAGMTVPFVPDTLAFQVGAVGALCRGTVEHAAADTDVTVETGGRSTAYVASESLTRRSADLPHVVDPDRSGAEVEAELGRETDPGVGTTRLLDSAVPDPTETLGYEQRPYEVSPLAALETLGSFADAPVERLRVADIRAGSLFVDGDPAYDNLVVPHAKGFDDATRVTIAAFVEAGGNLVLTDSGLELASGLDIPGLGSVESPDVTRQETQFAEYPGLDEVTGQDETPHPLVIDRPEAHPDSSIDRREPWRHPPLGYARGEVPTYTVAADALGPEAAVASASDERVGLATVPTRTNRIGVHLLGSLLPPATQENLHPFGLVDHALTSLGYLLLCNALGYQLVCSRDGDPVRTLGSLVRTDTTGGDDDDDGDNDDDGNNDDDEDNSTDNATEQAPDGTGRDGSGPGFGVPAGLAGGAGAGYLLSRYYGPTAGRDRPDVSDRTVSGDSEDDS